jgi:hypothetical protein
VEVAELNSTDDITLRQYDQYGRIRILELPSCLVDTGASHSYIYTDRVPAGMTTTALNDPIQVRNAFSKRISTIDHKLKVNLVLDESDIEISNVEFFVVEKKMNYNAIIGMDVLSNFKIDFRQDTVKFLNLIQQDKKKVATIIFESDKYHAPFDILSNENIELSPHSNRLLLFVTQVMPGCPKII